MVTVVTLVTSVKVVTLNVTGVTRCNFDAVTVQSHTAQRIAAFVTSVTGICDKQARDTDDNFLAN